MPKRKSPLDLGRRERQIMEVMFELGEAAVGDVRERLPDPPSYSAVRTMIRLLERKGLLKHRRDGVKYVYRPTQTREKVSRFAVAQLMKTFFAGSAADAMAALLDVASNDITDEDLERMAQLIENARKEGR
jgi:predicted transcriptional regulator